MTSDRLKVLPNELLLEIISYLRPSLPDLARCARVNRLLSQYALSVLYSDINLDQPLTLWEPEVEEKNDNRRLTLMHAIST